MQHFDDPLAKFRKRPIEARQPAAVAPADEAAVYCAFDAKDKVRRLQIRPAKESTYSLQYLELKLISYDRAHWTNIVLIFDLMSIRIRGKNLQPIVTAIESDSADFIQQFDPDLWQRPSDPKAPIIETLEVISNDDGVEPSGNDSEPDSKPH